MILRRRGKNAYSLLRKRRYPVACAFFLLADPPFLPPALEVVLRQMKDPALAFFLARLVKHAFARIREVASGLA